MKIENVPVMKLLLLSLTWILPFTLFTQDSISVTYTIGDIPTSFNSYDETCNGPVTILEVTLPPGEFFEVTNVHTEYTMTALGDGWRSHQRSKIRCANSGMEETEVSGVGDEAGPYMYSRDISVANGIYAGGTTVTFEMWARRTLEGTPGCNTNTNRVNAFSWVLTLYYGEEIETPKVGINVDIPEVLLDIRSSGLKDFTELNLGTPGNAQYTRIATGKEASLGSRLYWNPGQPFSFGIADGAGNNFQPYLRMDSIGRVGIGPGTPESSAILDASSTTKGFLPPRLTETQRDAISSPAEGLMIYNTSTGCPNYYSDGWYEVRGTPTYPPGTVHCNPANPTDIVAVLNPLTGKTWMDRNLGASRVATSSNDSLAYGDLYQWGRGADGHQCHSSATDTTLSSTDQPGHGNFILAPASPFDWRNPQNGTLWQGVNGVNNPCPTGYRLPTWAELDAERASWGEHNAAGAFASPLKLPVAGARLAESGLIFVGSSGFISSSTVSGTQALSLYFDPSDAFMNVSFRANGLSVRCIKD